MAECPAVADLPRGWTKGDGAALDALIPIVEAELRRLARVYMAREVAWQDRARFLGFAARLMRRVLVDHARARGMRKRDTVMRDWRLARLWLLREMDGVAS